MTALQRPDYEKPKIQRYGKFRDLTRIKCEPPGDGIWICRVPEVDDRYGE